MEGLSLTGSLPLILLLLSPVPEAGKFSRGCGMLSEWTRGNRAQKVRPLAISVEQLVGLYLSEVWPYCSPALPLPSSTSCCTQLYRQPLPTRLLRRIVRVELQEADGDCHLQAVV